MKPKSFVMRLLGEPLVPFALMGAVLFALDARRDDSDGGAEPARASEPRRIVVDTETERMLSDEFAKNNARRPTRAELDRMLDGFVETELLYREGLSRGLAEDDPVIRQRVASKMTFVIESQLALPAPSDAELRAWFERHPDRWRTPELFDFTHVFFSGPTPDARRRAAEAQSAIESGISPATLGDRFSGGRRYRRRKLADLEKTFGESFARELARQPLEKWAILQSRHGVHVVRLDARTPASAPDFERAKADVQKHWEAAQKNQHYARELERMRARWEIVKP